MIARILEHNPLSLTIRIEVNLNDAVQFHKVCRRFGAYTIPDEQELIERFFEEIFLDVLE